MLVGRRSGFLFGAFGPIFRCNFLLVSGRVAKILRILINLISFWRPCTSIHSNVLGSNPPITFTSSLSPTVSPLKLKATSSKFHPKQKIAHLKKKHKSSREPNNLLPNSVKRRACQMACSVSTLWFWRFDWAPWLAPLLSPFIIPGSGRLTLPHHSTCYSHTLHGEEKNPTKHQIWSYSLDNLSQLVENPLVF